VELILNWLWQGAVVALAAELGLALLPRVRAQARYWFAATACALVVALPAMPYVVTAASPMPALGTVSDALGPVVSMPAVWWTSASVVIALWILWSAVFAARLGAATLAVRAVKTRCRECPRDVEARLDQWSRVKSTGRRARLVLSPAVRAAAVLGGGSPTIALAPSILDQLDADDLDRIVIHEWAHVQRRDDVVQFVQRLVRVVAGWHPAVWWLERRLELEREVACDEIAVALTGSARGYAVCLATLAALPLRGAPALPVLAVSSSGLRRRVIRILAAGGVVSTRRSRAIAVCASLALAILSLVVGNMEIAQSAAAVSIGPAAAVAAPEAIATVRSTTPLAATVITPAPSVVSRRRSAASNRNADVTTDDAGRPGGARSTAPRPVAASSPDATPAAASGAIGTATPAPTLLASRVEGAWMASTPGGPPYSELKPRASWMAAADGGVAIGRRSQNAGVATAGFFSRFGKKVADSF
jgi:beta-lactamase regulating signal transducer with metallopeptidase domain